MEGRPGGGPRGRARGVSNPDVEEQTQGMGGLSLVNVARGGRSPGGSSGGSSGDARLSADEAHGSGNGNGNGNGGNGHRSPPGTRGTPRNGEQQNSRLDYVSSRPDGMDSKKGSSGQEIDLVANYFLIKRRPRPSGESWRLYKYRVDFNPDDDNIRLKKGLIKSLQTTLGPNVCDGHLLYVSRPLGDHLVQPNTITAASPQGNQFLVTLKLVEEVNPTDPMYIVFYNNLIKKAQQMLDLDEMNRNYFDRRQAIPYRNYNLELWPGFVTVMRQHENSVLLCVEVTHKVLRTDSVLGMMSSIRQNFRGSQEEMQEAVERQLIGKIVMTEYNRKTYRVDEIKWNVKPTATFQQKGVDVSFVDYYNKKYGIAINSMGQPLLASNPKARDIRRGQTGQFLLIPELCRMTGLTDELRSNFRLMKDLGEHLFMVPENRVRTMCALVNRITTDPAIKAEHESWGIRISPNPIQIKGRVMPMEKIFFGGQISDFPDQKADWTRAFQGKSMISSVPLKTWVILVPERDSQGVDNLLKTMRQVAGPLKFLMSAPKPMIRIGNPNVRSYTHEIEKAMNEYGQDMTMFFIILPNNKLELYSAVKKQTYINYGIPSQCFLAKNIQSKGLMSIATKVIVQMNAKLGGEPWAVDIPLKNMMVVGFDVYHGATDRKGNSVGAMVASVTKNCTRYFSTVSFHGNNEELSMNVCAMLTKCLTAYKASNPEGKFPDRIMFYRDGVGEGQLQFVYASELLELKKAITSLYVGAGQGEPTFTFIVVTKRINTRIMNMIRGRPENPPPGTVVDDVITLPERFDFYIVAQNVRQGTVSPTSYNILFDNSNLGPDKIQRMTYKLCHMYYNWSGTVGVPSPVQYAHKVAFLTGTALGHEAHQNLHHLLYFL